MIVPALIIWILARTSSAPAFAVETWAWMCHHVILTIVILLVTG
jgi:hypothetical protein